MSSPSNLPSSYASSLVAPIMATLSALTGIFGAAVFLGLGATLALDGTGRYRLLANLAWIGIVLSTLGALFMVWLAISLWHHSSNRVHWVRWLAPLQLVLLLLALGAVAYGHLRVMLYIPLLVGLVCNIMLLRNTQGT